jgi:magnesium chelatase subunit D
VGLIIFHKDRAVLVLPPTNSVILAEKALSDIPVGGKTPLSAGIQLAYDVLEKEKILHPDVVPILIVLTDGAGNVSMGYLPPLEEAYMLAEMIAEQKTHSIVINMEHITFDQGLARDLADHLKAPCFTVSDLKAENLYLAVRQAEKSVNEEKR